MCDCDCEMPEFFNVRNVKAKKEHKCCECDATILVGHEYQYATGKWDGDFNSHKTCMRCSNLRDEYMKKGDCVCFEGLMEHISEIGEVWPQDYIDRRNKMIEARRNKTTPLTPTTNP